MKVEVQPGHTVDRGTNKIFHPGESFTCSEAEANRLIELGVVLACGSETGEPTAERLEALVAAIRTLPADDPGLWTGRGIPTIEALGAASGTRVTAMERDLAWAEHMKRAMEDSE